MAIPLILCGGGGTRLWPLSQPQHPKPFLRLLGEYSLFQQTLQRCRAFAAPVILCHADHLPLVQQQCDEIGIAPHSILLEPQARGTAAAVAAACLHLKSTFAETPLLLLPADLAIQNQAAFEKDMQRAIEYTTQHQYVTFGICPTRPKPRFGYIEAGDALDEDVFTLKRFIGKPAAAHELASHGDQKYFWNSGMFAMSLAQLHDSLQTTQPELMRIVADAVRNDATKSHQSTFMVALQASTFSAAPQLSFETAIREKFAGGIMLRAHFDWNDAGTWNALWELQSASAGANVIHGKARLHDSRGCYIHATTKRISVLGCDDLVIVETGDEIFVSTRQAAEKAGIFSASAQNDSANTNKS